MSLGLLVGFGVAVMARQTYVRWGAVRDSARFQEWSDGSSFTQESLPLLDHGPFGCYQESMVQGVHVRSPVIERSPLAGSVPQTQGLLVFITGANTDETCLGELPQMLALSGWGVKIVVVPGYERIAPRGGEDASDVSFLKGGMRRCRALVRIWEESTKVVLAQMISGHAGPVVIGGFSLGGALALSALTGLEPELLSRVQGVLLVAPCLHARYFTEKHPLKRAVLRRLAMPAVVELRKDRNRSRAPEIDPEISSRVRVLLQRPYTSELAAVIAGERACGRVATWGDRLRAARLCCPPFLLFNGGLSDPTVDISLGENLLFGRFPSGKLVTERFKGAGHWLLVGKQRKEVFAEVQKFMGIAS